MSELQTSVPATLVSSDMHPAADRNGSTMLHTCLVVSESTGRAERFTRAAHREHWATIVCNNAEEAARRAVRRRIQMALVDLESASAPQQPPLCRFVEQLAGRNGPLVVVCGKPDDAAREVWSRRLGVWMYLPGIDNACDFALLYGEARRVVEKLDNGAVRPRCETNGVNSQANVPR